MKRQSLMAALPSYSEVLLSLLEDFLHVSDQTSRQAKIKNLVKNRKNELAFQC